MSFQLYADKNRLYRKDWEAVTSGSVNVYAVRYQFSSDWDGLTKTVIFKAEGTIVEVPLDEGNGCIIPWEVLTKHGIKLYVGVGTRGGDTVLPTIWTFLGEVLEGAEPNTEYGEPAVWRRGRLSQRGRFRRHTVRLHSDMERLRRQHSRRICVV